MKNGLMEPLNTIEKETSNNSKRQEACGISVSHVYLQQQGKETTINSLLFTSLLVIQILID